VNSSTFAHGTRENHDLCNIRTSLVHMPPGRFDGSVLAIR
jgi:hypothetical protein